MSYHSPIQNHDPSDRITREFLEYLNEDTLYLSDNTDKSLRKSASDSILSTQSFSSIEIPDSIKNSLFEMGYDRLSKNQIESIPRIQKGDSLMYKSDSGTGKTISFVVGTLSSVHLSKNAHTSTNREEYLNNESNNEQISGSNVSEMEDTKPDIVVISPTLELNDQIASVYQSVGFSSGITVRNVKRGDRVTLLRENVLVGSPHAIANTLRSLRIKNVPILVIDEADVVLSPDKMGTVTFQILSNVQFNQYLFFSATYSQEIRNMINKNCKSVIDMTNIEKTIPMNIRLYHLVLNQQSMNEMNHQQTDDQSEKKEEVLNMLYSILNIGQSIIFVNTKKKADRLHSFFTNDLHKVSVLHGDLEITDRKNVTDSFRNGETKILITTDVFSRGIDIPSVNLVINYDLPVSMNKPDISTYIHRIGRCGRFGRNGFVVDLITNKEDSYILKCITDSINKPSQPIQFDSIYRVAQQSIQNDNNGLNNSAHEWTQDN
ncbi:ATP-dependent RNA helicase [Pseudoloma neurophilia]|uniref:RNA helicase n=1 Tax=Pseudoloma neurophilia TaxID=146866 RepID=A0A0R0M207_9MICR|nr:ATP-dependent RNA helicase [Pseudoloma neurophilia]